MRARQQRIDDLAFDLAGRREALEKNVARKNTPTMGEEAELARLTKEIINLVNQGTNLSDRINNLRSPGEHERRVNHKLANITSLKRLTERKDKMAKETAKDQGVPDVYLNEKGNFKIGMDARLKSDLVLSALGLISKAEPGQSLHVFTEKEATDLLGKRDWMGFLDRKKAIIAEQETKKAANAAKREEAARERAAAKEAKDAEKKAAAAAKAAEAKSNAEGGSAAEAKASGQAQPDFKGASGQRRGSRSSAGASK